MRPTFFFLPTIIFAIIYLNVPDDLVVDPFQFREFDQDLILYSFYIFFVSWLLSTVGSFLCARLVKNNFYENNYSPKKIILSNFHKNICIAFFIGILVHFFYAFYSSFEFFGESVLSDRIFIDKKSQYVLILFGLISYVLIGQSSWIFKNFINISILFVSLLIAGIDISREALIPLAFIIFFYLYEGKNRLILFLWILFSCFILVLVMFRRDYQFLDLINQGPFILLKYFIESLAYISSFNLFHHGQAIYEGSNMDFSLNYFLLSIAPLPSSFIGGEVLEGRNFDVYRPYGASADILSLNKIAFAIYWIFFGFLARLSTYRNGIYRVLLIALLFVLFVTSFQYPLRTSSKFFYLIIIVLFIRDKFRNNILLFGKSANKMVK